ncbi:50S ribosomal protein L29 [Buchnera aphidicola (Panaphis juglandis)]
MKVSFLKKQTLNDLNFELLNLLKEQFNLKIQLSSGKLKKFHILRKVRKNIARIKTIITEKKGIITHDNQSKNIKRLCIK